ncbi:hypothetical protein MLD38_002985 [Melastoma candidum]|nr:hypothetical protein MLD38_002985 [Melastoma candidum]
MTSAKDLTRILSGISLVAKEFSRRSDPLRAAREGDFPGLLRSVARAAVFSATDIAGLTRGTTRALPQERPGDVSGGRGSESSSVVYFDQAGAADVVGREREGGSRDGVERRVEEELAAEAAVDAFVSEGGGSSRPEGKIEAGVGAGEFGGKEDVMDGGEAGPTSSTAVVQTLPVKRRKPRERRVPSTPFTRALG